MSLLAAFRSSGDTNYLNEAATNFPNDPHVELSVLAHDEFPADRRKWLGLVQGVVTEQFAGKLFVRAGGFQKWKK